MNIQSIVLIILIAVGFVAAIVYMVRSGGTCSCSSGGCSKDCTSYPSSCKKAKKAKKKIK